jgi:gluconokinase
MVVVLMGVSGSGKTRVGRLLARRLGWPFVEGDDLHSRRNREKMRRGIPLTDADRAPWLRRVRGAIRRVLRRGGNAVLACSALKESYRRILRVDPQRVKLVHLEGSQRLIRARLARRRDHFMNPALLDSQFATLEKPRGVIRIRIDRSPGEIVRSIQRKLGIRARSLVEARRPA